MRGLRPLSNALGGFRSRLGGTCVCEGTPLAHPRRISDRRECALPPRGAAEKRSRSRGRSSSNATAKLRDRRRIIRQSAAHHQHLFDGGLHHDDMASRSGALFTDIALYQAFASRKQHAAVSSSSSGHEQHMTKRMESDGGVGRDGNGGGLVLFGWRMHRSESREITQNGCTRLAPLAGCTCFDQDRMGASAPEFDAAFESSAPLYDDEDMAPSAPELTPTALYGRYCLDRMPSAPMFMEDDEEMEGGEDEESSGAEEHFWGRDDSIGNLGSIM